MMMLFRMLGEDDCIRMAEVVLDAPAVAALTVKPSNTVDESIPERNTTAPSFSVL
jgi:hypothetical protein